MTNLAYLYQEIMNVPGLSGTWQQRNAQLYSMLGSPMGKYTGSLNQNLFLLDQIKKNNYFRSGLPGQTQQAQAPAQPTVSSGAQAGQSATEGTVQTPWEQVTPWEQFFDENLAKSAIAQRTARYFDPLVSQARQGVESDYAGRNLTRSSMRGKSVLDMYRDFAEQEQTMREQLYGQREGEAKQDYRYQQSLYEKDPKGYSATPFKSSGYEYQFPEESPQRYSQSYRDWLRRSYNI